jgi:hypothetical protein
MGNLSDAAQALIFFALFGLSAWCGVWAYKDAQRRGKPGALVGFLVFLITFPVGIVAWIAFRPERTS